MTRLERELRTARDRQAATSEILRVISQSPSNVQPVFDTIVLAAERLLRCDMSFVMLCEPPVYWVAAAATPEGLQDGLTLTRHAIDPSANFPSRVIVEKQALYLPNWSRIDLPERERHVHETIGVNSALYLPLLRHGECIGLLTLGGKKANLFGDSEIALAESFRDQALIAIENTRLFNETKEALEHQTATSDVLQAIGSSMADTKPVFERILDSVERLFDIRQSSIILAPGDGMLHLAARRGAGTEAMDQLYPAPVDQSRGSEVVRTARQTYVPSAASTGGSPLMRRVAEAVGDFSVVMTPMVWKDEGIGMLSVSRAPNATFSKKELALLCTFSDQAVIAIENARLFNETQEALERQTATADILKVISRSAFDLDSVMNTLTQSAAELCKAEISTLYLREGDMLVARGVAEVDAEQADFLRRTPLHIDASTYTGRAFLSGSIRNIADIAAESEIGQLKAFAEKLGFNSILFVPLMREGRSVGIFALARRQTGYFSQREIDLLQTFADQAVIAIENVRLFDETQEALERQTATADILKVIASSPSDVQPVFEAIAERSNRLMNGLATSVYSIADDTIHLMAFTRTSPEADAALQTAFPRPLSATPGGDRIRRGAIVEIPDAEVEWAETPDMLKVVQLRGFRSVLFVPLMRDGTSVGVISVTRRETGRFAPHHVQLLQTFADQAVIAIENTRLFNETQEALARQTATSDILRVISQSPTDVQPVFDAIVAAAVRLLRCDGSFILRCDGANFAAVAAANPDGPLPVYNPKPRPVDPDADFPSRAIATRKNLHLPDWSVIELPEFERQIRETRGYNSALFLPLLRGEDCIGVIGLASKRANNFSADDIALAESFRDQALIAIENTRLFNETQEALDQQTATSEVLAVISRSPSDLNPVLEAISDTAARLCGSEQTMFFRYDGAVFRILASWNFPPDVHEMLERRPLHPGHPSAIGRAGASLKPVCIPDVLADANYGLTGEQSRARYRATLAVPLLREGRLIGALSLNRSEPGAFTEKQIELVTTFADQAVIAIENVRLFDEVQAKTKDLTEALAYQTGSSNVLRVIASSPTDVDPVLKAIVESARELCEANDAVALLKDGENLRFSAHSGPIAVMHDRWPINRNWTAGRAFVDRKPVHVHDMLSEEGAEFPDARAMGQTTGSTIHTVLSVPLLRGDESIGAILLRRTEVRPFTEKQVDLLSTFADQAVIAIQNARMFNETREALEQQKASADILNVISNSVAETQPVFDEILRSVARLFGSQENFIFLVGEDGLLHVGAGSGPRVEQVRGLFPTPLEGTVSQVAIRERRLVVSVNVFDDAELPLPAREGYRRLGENYAMVVAPMLWEDRAIGSIMVARASMTPFSEKECNLLRTFADQAVIAIQNARLFDQVQAKTTDLEESLQQQTATADVLKVISRSAFDLQTVLDTLVESAAKLCEADEGIILQPNENGFGLAANWGLTPGKKEFIQSRTFRPGSSTLTGRVLTHGNVVHIRDVFEDPGFSSEGDPNPARTRLGVPLLRDGSPVGVFVLTRLAMQPFTEKQIELVSTFSDQAVIAIENARLFDEVQARTKELAASLEDLRTAQDRLVQTEKLASLGQLTAGIAHEIKNPLNFVNNFSALSVELTDELNDLLKPAPLDDKMRGDVDELTALIKANLEKVVQHGKRADSIVKNMLLHSREGSGEQRPTDINALLDESLNLAYHGARAERPGFNITLQRDFDAGAGTVEGFPQEITRAFLNLISNGFYAATKRHAENGEANFEPLLVAATKNLGGHVEIRIRDNGTGIPAEVKEKMFNPFFTTKPAGEGTGLGLSMTHDIVVKQHGGRIDVSTEPGQFTEFTIVLPRTIRK